MAPDYLYRACTKRPNGTNSPVLSARLHTERHLPMRVTTTTTKFGSYCVVEPVNETETGWISRYYSCHENWTQLRQRCSISCLSIDSSQQCCLIELARSCGLGGRVVYESVLEPTNETGTGATSRNDSCHENWSHLRQRWSILCLLNRLIGRMIPTEDVACYTLVRFIL